MLVRKIHIRYWTILFLFSVDQYDMERIYDALVWADAPNSIISKVERNVLSGRLNEGFTYSDPSSRRTVFATGVAESGPEVLDSVVHEIIHICQHVALEDGMGLFVTAPASDYDFVSRTFFPKIKINEDPVCGSAHCNLIPYWSERLHKTVLTAYQASPRGGVLYCEDRGDRVRISGHAVLYSQAEINV